LKSVAIPTDLGKFKCLGMPIFILKILILWLYNIYEFIFIAFEFEFGQKMVEKWIASWSDFSDFKS
jgi:hypothetical protein